MKLCVLMFLLPFALPGQTPPTPAQPAALKPEDLGAISGILLNAATDAPIRFATVILSGVAQPYTVTTDADGKFTITGVPPGRYRTTVDRTGFAKPAYTGRILSGASGILELTRGQTLNDVRLRVLPHGVVTGRITGLGGDPVAGVQVLVLKVVYSRDGKTLSVLGMASSNDLGEYRVYGLAPGKVLVAAMERASNRPVLTVVSPLPMKAEEQYIRTYYPGVPEVSAASSINVEAGGEARGIDIRLARARTVVVRGRVIKNDLPEGTVASVVMLGLRPNRDPVDPFSSYNSNFDAKGLFEFSGVRPGSYDLKAMTSHNGKAYSSRMRVDVGEDPIDNLTITIGPGVALNGRVRMEKEADALQGNPHVRLILRDSHLIRSQPYDVAVNPDRTFSIPNVSPDRYEVQVAPLPAGSYVKVIRSEDRDVLNTGLDVVAGAAPSLDIVLSAAGAEVSGTVQGADSKPVVNPIVVLIPQETAQRDSLANYHRSTAAQNGAFRLRGLPPGEYKIFAWQIMDDLAYLDPEFLKPLDSKGKSITLEEHGSQVIELRAVDSE